MTIVKQGSAEWLQQRAGKINSSTCAAFEAKHKFKKAMDVVRDSVRDLAGAESEFKTNDAVEHGRKTEPVATDFFEQHTGLRVEATGSIEHPEYSFLRASPDGLVGLDACLEVKCPYAYGRKTPNTYSIFDEDKTMYLWQVKMQMECLDVDVCHFICYVSPDVFHIDKVVREAGWLEQPVSGSLLPTPRDNWVPRVGLFQAWHNFIHSEYQDPETRKKYLDGKDHCKRVDGDPLLDELSQKWRRKISLEAQIEEKAGQEKQGLATLLGEIDELKKSLKAQFDSNVTNGLLQVHITNKAASFNYKNAFEAVGGKQRIKDLGLDAAAFNNKSVKQISNIKLEETTNG